MRKYRVGLFIVLLYFPWNHRALFAKLRFPKSIVLLSIFHAALTVVMLHCKFLT